MQGQVDAVQGTDSAPREQPADGKVFAQSLDLKNRLSQRLLPAAGTGQQPRHKSLRGRVGG